jgi:hypothetical protein
MPTPISFVFSEEERRLAMEEGSYGHEAMKEEYWADPARGRPAYFVPKEALHSMDALLVA